MLVALTVGRPLTLPVTAGRVSKAGGEVGATEHSPRGPMLVAHKHEQGIGRQYYYGVHPGLWQPAHGVRRLLLLVVVGRNVTQEADLLPAHAGPAAPKPLACDGIAGRHSKSTCRAMHIRGQQSSQGHHQEWRLKALVFLISSNCLV
jgi:hypothetical protein